MSPIVKKKKASYSIPTKYILFTLTLICSVLMLITFGTGFFHKPFNTVFGYVLVPFEEGIGSAGKWFSDKAEELASIRSLLEENQSLKDKVAQLTEENTLLLQDKYELNELRDLLKLDKQYDSYEKIGARVIAKDPGNWFSSFVVDKGSEDGILEDMNVIADGGLVGRVSSVGPNWCKITSIVSDNSNVSAMVLATNDNMIVSGSLKDLADGVIVFSQLVDSKNQVNTGDKVVTSNISDRFLPNVLIGYIQNIGLDNNNLTKSGTLIPAVDFEHLSEVLIITDLKQTIGE